MTYIKKQMQFYGILCAILGFLVGLLGAIFFQDLIEHL